MERDVPYIVFEGEMARKLREMMDDAPDANTKNEIQRLADRVEQM